MGSDAIIQHKDNKKINLKQSLFKMFLAPIYAETINGLMWTGDMVGKYLWDNPVAKAVLGPNLFANLTNPIVLANEQIGKENKYSFPKLIKHYATILEDKRTEKEKKEDNEKNIKNNIFKNFKRNFVDKVDNYGYKQTVKHTLTSWNIFQIINYYAVPQHLRTIVTIGPGAIWSYLSTSWGQGRHNQGKSITKQK
ncbi:hypothetical protein K9L67_02585 [Candidatus Woesearchaeota archaeon]|nr:hypothetical protein [Candidatus Woesearchaeota archaeon]MCF7901092.1 hypothetical protein [Candidatus Woesearchaeota archaeon]MCF8013425.1 hypothetical protein [Candidatus Woesearchaeota archaeon]